MAGAQTFCIHKTTKVVIINKHKYFVIAIFQIVLQYFKGLNNSQKFTIISFVSSFGWN